MSHRYRVVKTTSLPGTYGVTNGWTPYCACGWAGTEGDQGPRPGAARAAEFIDHLRALDQPAAGGFVDLAPAAGLDLYNALIARALEALRSEEE